MNTEFFIAKRFYKGKNRSTGVSGPVIDIAVWGIGLGLAVMIIAVAVVTGFKTQIRNKVIGFGAHIQISSYDLNTSFETQPISKNQPFYEELKKDKGIKHIQAYAIKPGIIKTDDAIEGVVVKGVGSDFDWNFFDKNLVEGKSFRVNDTASSNDVVISKFIANRLKLKKGDDLVMYFIQQPTRIRKFKIAGIYQSGMEELDKLFLFADIKHIQKLNDWDSTQVSGFEIFIKNFNRLNKMHEVIDEQIGAELYSKTIEQAYPQIFDWLNLQNVNEQVILGIMIFVAMINMITALLILIIEKTRMIGILKAIGMSNWGVKKVFLYKGAYLIGKGLLRGNVLGLGVCILQLKFGFLKLDEANYYIKTVPVILNFKSILLLNIGTFIVILIALILPSLIISRISPVKAIRFS